MRNYFLLIAVFAFCMQITLAAIPKECEIACHKILDLVCAKTKTGENHLFNNPCILKIAICIHPEREYEKIPFSGVEDCGETDATFSYKIFFLLYFVVAKIALFRALLSHHLIIRASFVMVEEGVVHPIPGPLKNPQGKYIDSGHRLIHSLQFKSATVISADEILPQWKCTTLWKIKKS
ncbi:hypothetical protein Trydic_g20516 [Trypoxylus dichotomus]